ncbi:MAG: carboxymuconolactone decarboxylase family protein [Acidimicrobiales bacterium]
MRLLHQVQAVVGVLSRARRNRTDFLRAMIRRPQILAASLGYELGILFSARVDPRLKTLAELKVAAIVACEYCLDIASAMARHDGLTEQQLRALPSHRDSPAFDDTERLVLDVAEALTRAPAALDDDLRQRFESTFDPAQRTELLAVIAWENQRARLNQGLGVRPAGFSDGEFCALPQPA